MFENQLSNFMVESTADKDTAAFGTYSHSHYMNCVEEWAYCHQCGAGINTNMYIEAMHKNIKHYYLGAEKNQCLDKCLNELMKYI